MRVLSLVCLVLCVCCVGRVSGQPLDIFIPSFKDPYSDKVQDVLLDINVRLCSEWPNDLLDTIDVTVPTAATPDAPGNTGYFVGAAFTRTVVGTSFRGSSVPATLTLHWDGVSKLTFSGFASSGPAVVPTSSKDGRPFWVNVNWDIPSTLFVDPAGPLASDPNFVPLKLVKYSTITDSFAPQINQVAYDLFQANPKGGNLPQACRSGSSTQDPIFSGFQGQVFQFHGLPDEHFNLVSSPDVQLNSHFVYLSSGKCDYNDTECYTHPGTYMDVLGFSILDSHVKLVAGTHEAGLRIWLNDQEIPRATHIKAFTNTSAYIKYHHNGRVDIHTEIMNFEIANSDMFMNIHVALNNRQLLRVGGIRHTVTDHAICKANTETSNHQLIEQTVAAKYPVTTPLHGLIGQTWRNVKVCSKDWMGTVQDYITSDLFASDYHYNYFNW